MPAGITIHSGSPVLEEPAVQVLIQHLQYFRTQKAVLFLETLFPDVLKALPRMVHHPVELACFRASSPIVLALISYLLPCVSPYHIELIVEVAEMLPKWQGKISRQALIRWGGRTFLGDRSKAKGLRAASP